MLYIPDALIVSYSISPQVYQKGLEYYREGRIQSLRMLEDKPIFHAVVRGSKDYQVRIEFLDNGIYFNSVCTCPSQGRSWRHCKHIVAVLLHLKRLKEKGNLSALVVRSNSRKIFQFFEQVPGLSKKQVTLEPVFEYVPAYESRYDVSTLLSLKVGLDRMYVVRQVDRFLKQLDQGDVIEFGKSFTFDPGKHEIPSGEGTLLGFLQEVYEIDQLGGGALERRSSNLFRNKYLCLSDTLVKRFFTLMGNKPFQGVFFGKEVPEVQIIRERIPTSFTAQNEEDTLTFRMQVKDPVYPLTEDMTYALAGARIYRLPEEQNRSLMPFIQVMGQPNTDKMVFYGSDKERFVSEILPYAKEVGEVHISEELSGKLIRKPLQAEVYFDRDGHGIQARVKFLYGERNLDPFEPNRQISEADHGDQILVRDTATERKILELFEQFGFLVQPNRIYLEDEQRILDFFYEGLPALTDLAAVFYSDDFKFTVREKAVSYMGIRLNEDTNYLEFSFDTGDIDPVELVKVLAALREKKRYYRLKDGSFLPLEGRDLHGLAQIVDDLGLRDRDLAEGMLKLPKYRALYLDRKLRELAESETEQQPAFQQLLKDIENPGEIQVVLPSSLKGVLRDYQRMGFQWLKTLSHYDLGGILADDMGLGKTLQILTLLLSEKEEGSQSPSLVVAPTSLIYNWEDEVRKFVPDLKTIVITGTKAERKKQMEEIPNSHLVITSYPLIRRDLEAYKEYSFRHCIIDEAQHIKNPNSQNARAVKSIHAQRRFALTGTPIENALSELWSIFDFVMPGYLLSHSKFVSQYERPIVKEQNPEAAEKLAAQIRPFVLRRLKTDVLKELPEKIETRMMTELTEDQKKVYLAYLARARGEIAVEIDRSGFEKSHIKILSAITRLRQICCHPGVFLEDYKGDSGKLQQLEELIPDALAGGHRILLFSQFTSMLKRIRQLLEKLKVPLFYLDGTTDARERNQMVKLFNEGEKKVFLISLKAGGTGLNLTGADTVIHFDPWWNPAVEEQASDRAHRIGQEKVVHVMRLITRGTIEEKIEGLKEKKRSLADAVIRPGETLVSRLSRDEIMALFE